MTSEEAALRVVRRAGAKHFHEGRAYIDNPYDQNRQPKYHLAWSEGHNGARATAALLGEKND